MFFWCFCFFSDLWLLVWNLKLPKLYLRQPSCFEYGEMKYIFYHGRFPLDFWTFQISKVLTLKRCDFWCLFRVQIIMHWIRANAQIEPFLLNLWCSILFCFIFLGYKFVLNTRMKKTGLRIRVLNCLELWNSSVPSSWVLFWSHLGWNRN